MSREEALLMALQLMGSNLVDAHARIAKLTEIVKKLEDQLKSVSKEA